MDGKQRSRIVWEACGMPQGTFRVTHHHLPTHVLANLNNLSGSDSARVALSGALDSVVSEMESCILTLHSHVVHNVPPSGRPGESKTSRNPAQKLQPVTVRDIFGFTKKLNDIAGSEPSAAAPGIKYPKLSPV
eukprot:1454602-Rhodomonas_salina.1